MSALELRLATALDRSAWDQFVERMPTAEATHLWAFGSLIEDCFQLRSYRLIAERDGQIEGLLPLASQSSFVGRFLTSLPYLNHSGVLSNSPEVREALAQRALALGGEVGAQRVEIRGREGADLPLPVWNGKNGYELELPDDSEVLWTSLRSKVRAQVKRPRKEGYASRVADVEALPIFYRLLSQRWHQLGSPILPYRFFEKFVALFGSQVKLVLVEREGVAAAAGLLLGWRGSVEIPWAASDFQANRFGVNMLLYWEALEEAIRSGADRFDFGRSTPGTGNAKFKLQWGAAERALSWNLATSGEQGQSAERGDRKRELVANTWRRLPRFVVGWLGPHLAARIPY